MTRKKINGECKQYDHICNLYKSVINDLSDSLRELDLIDKDSTLGLSSHMKNHVKNVDTISKDEEMSAMIGFINGIFLMWYCLNLSKDDGNIFKQTKRLDLHQAGSILQRLLLKLAEPKDE